MLLAYYLLMKYRGIAFRCYSGLKYTNLVLLFALISSYFSFDSNAFTLQYYTLVRGPRCDNGDLLCIFS